MLQRIHIGFATALALIAGAAHAEDSAPKDGFTIKPVLLDSKDKDSTTLVLEYKFSGKMVLANFTPDDSASPDPTADVPIGSVDIAYKGSGDIATSASKNPKNFLDGQISLDASYSGAATGSFAAGVTVKVETDQTFKKSQSVIGAHATYGKYAVFGRNDFFALDLNYGRVDPGKDADRLKVLGVTSLDSYNRIDGEVLYMYPTGWSVIQTVELDYRFFYETDAPAKIKAADLDAHQLGTIRLGLPNDLFIAYSSGKLPFDKKNDHILALGFSYKLF